MIDDRVDAAHKVLLNMNKVILQNLIHNLLNELPSLQYLDIDHLDFKVAKYLRIYLFVFCSIVHLVTEQSCNMIDEIVFLPSVVWIRWIIVDVIYVHLPHDQRVNDDICILVIFELLNAVVQVIGVWNSAVNESSHSTCDDKQKHDIEEP